MIKIVVNINDENKRIDNFLTKYFDGISKTTIFKWIRTNKVKVNDKKVKIDYRLQFHDEIKIYVNLDIGSNTNELWFRNTKVKLDIIFEDNNIIIINKPVNLASQNLENNKDSVQKALLNYLYDTKQYVPENENTFIPSICNRLDTNTAGIIVAAKNAKALNCMNEIFKQHLLIKRYKALVIGNLEPTNATLNHFHYKDANKNIVYISDEPKKGYKPITTKYKKLEYNGKYSLVDVELVTGRTHQIRAHFNHIGYPLVGESKYKSRDTNTDSRFKNQALVSYYLEFKIDDKTMFLAYLNNKKFIMNNIWFMDLFSKK